MALLRGSPGSNPAAPHPLRPGILPLHSTRNHGVGKRGGKGEGKGLLGEERGRFESAIRQFFVNPLLLWGL